MQAINTGAVHAGTCYEVWKWAMAFMAINNNWGKGQVDDNGPVADNYNHGPIPVTQFENNTMVS